MRLRLVLDKEKRAYVGTATTPDAQWTVHADITSDDDVTLATDAPADVADYTRRVVRIAVRAAKADGTPAPRVIQRWRAPQ